MLIVLLSYEKRVFRVLPSRLPLGALLKTIVFLYRRLKIVPQSQLAARSMRRAAAAS